MALTLNASLLRELQTSEPESLVMYVAITLTGGGTPYEFVNANGNRLTGIGYHVPENVIGVTPVAQRLDPLSRAAQAGEITVELMEDEFVRDLLVNNRLIGKKLEVKLGHTALSAANYAPVFLGMITEAYGEHGKVTIVGGDALSVSRKHKVSGAWVSKHPLEIIESLIDDAGIPSDLKDTTTLDPKNSTDISHFAVSRGNVYAGATEQMKGVASSFGFTDRWPTAADVASPKPAWDIIQELSQLLNGSLVPRENGQLSFLSYDSSASTEQDWGEDDLISVRVVETQGNLANEVIVDFNHLAFTDGDASLLFSVKDSTSQTNHAYPGEASRIVPLRLKTDWCNSSATLGEDITNSQTGNIAIRNGYFEFCGTNELAGGSQSSEFQFSAGRPGYIRIGDEIIKTTSALVKTNGGIVHLYGEEGEVGAEDIVGDVTFNIAARGQFGTTAVSHDKGDAAVDVTIPIHMAQERLNRFSNGIPILEVITHLHTYEVQIGDFVSVNEPGFIAYGLNGLSDTDKFEVVGKELDITNARIKWRLAYVQTAAVTSTGIETLVRKFKTGPNKHYGMTKADGTSHTGVVSGFTASAGAGFSLDITSGLLNTPGGPVAMENDVAITLEASKTYHIEVDQKGAIYAKEDGSESETLGLKGMHKIAEVVTDGSAVTSVDTTMKAATWLKGKYVDKKSIETEEMSRESEVGKSVNFNSNFGHWPRT